MILPAFRHKQLKNFAKYQKARGALEKSRRDLERRMRELEDKEEDNKKNLSRCVRELAIARNNLPAGPAEAQEEFPVAELNIRVCSKRDNLSNIY